jgi:organic hydroperoxide reductase OsmC/OhrA
MHPYPHTYVAAASGGPSGLAPVTSPGAPELITAPPPEFDGPEGYWSPETLLTASVANCFILTFRGVSRAARFGWRRLECRVEAVLERRDGVAQFTAFKTDATLTVAPDADAAKAKQLLEKAEHLCLIANSLRGARALEARVVTAGDDQ